MSLSLEEKKRKLQLLKRELEKDSLIRSKTKNKKAYMDYLLLEDLSINIGEKFDSNFNRFIPNGCSKSKLEQPSRFIPSDLERNHLINGYDLANIMSSYVSMFEEAGYYCFNNPAFISLNRNERIEIMASYLDTIIPNGGKYLKDKINGYDILISENITDDLGVTYSIVSKRNGDTILVNDELVGRDIAYMRVVIHELLHMYSCDFLRNYSSDLYDALSYGNLGETLSMYSEISFQKFLIDNHIYEDKTNFNLNYYLDNVFTYFSSFKYLFSCLKENGDIEIFQDDYIVTPKREIIDGTYGTFSYVDQNLFGEGTFYDFKYIIGFLKAMDFIDIEKNGGNIDKAMKEFLLSMTDSSQELDILINGKNDDMIKKLIKDNTNACMKLYRYK